MKRNLLLTLLSTFCFTIAFSQITHKDFGEGMVVGLSENLPFDIDEDGEVDLYINQQPNELGFTPIFAKGCIASPTETSYTSFDAREIQIFEEGDVIQITSSNLYDYIDDDRGSLFHQGQGLANGWEHLQFQYIGIAVFNQDGDALNAWMKVAVDTEANTLIIKELAYENYLSVDEGHIVAGDTGSVSVENLDQVLNELVISPNPVVDILQLSFDYSGEEKLQISILDNTGRLITSQTANGSVKYTFNTANWTSGLYFVNFSSNSGVQSEKIFVSK